jgi:diadenosine tetraphosphatase ApaH/serine/threonine PP2A family protein phosphatase
MLYAILSDIHGNATALARALEAIDHGTEEPVDQIWCLGDVVGYGPDPNECLALLRSRAHRCIAGNHDWGVAGLTSLDRFSFVARRAAEWTREHLTPENLEYLQQLPTTLTVVDCTLVHASPRDPIWEYLLSIDQAEENFPLFNTRYCLVGHTHVPAIFLEYETGPEAEAARDTPTPTRATEDDARETGEFTAQGCDLLETGEDWWQAPPGCRAIVNPGSVGQPRDGDPRAAIAFYDPARGFHFRRLEYDITAVQERILAAGLPRRLAERLSYGM